MLRAPQELRTYFVTTVTANRRRRFQVEANANLLLEVMLDHRSKGRFELHAFVIMPDHFHALLTPAPDVSLEKAMQFIKGGFSFRLKSKLDVWSRSFNESQILSREKFEACKRYIEENPVRRNLSKSAHPAELLLGDSGKKLFALIPASNEVQVIDTQGGKVTATWAVSSKSPGDAALDETVLDARAPNETASRLLIGTHTPPSMIAMDSTTGKEVASEPTVEGMDGVYYDSKRERVYVSGGRGFETGAVFVYQRASAGGYENIAKLPTRAGAGTSFWSPQLDRYYVAAPAHDGEQAAILVFRPQ